MTKDSNFDDENIYALHARLKVMIEDLKSSLVEKEASIRSLEKENGELRKIIRKNEALKQELEAMI